MVKVLAKIRRKFTQHICAADRSAREHCCRITVFLTPFCSDPHVSAIDEVWKLHWRRVTQHVLQMTCHGHTLLVVFETSCTVIYNFDLLNYGQRLEAGTVCICFWIPELEYSRASFVAKACYRGYANALFHIFHATPSLIIAIVKFFMSYPILDPAQCSHTSCRIVDTMYFAQLARAFASARSYFTAVRIPSKARSRLRCYSLHFSNCCLRADSIIEKLQQNNVFMIAKRTVEGKDMVYLSLQLPREMWVLMELKVSPGLPVSTYAVSGMFKIAELITSCPISVRWYFDETGPSGFNRMKSGGIKTRVLQNAAIHTCPAGISLVCFL